MDVLKFFRKQKRMRVFPLTQESAAEDLKAWRVVTLENEERGEKTVFRIRMTKPKHPDVELLQTAVEIRWPFESASTMPSKAENDQQLEFERALDPLTCENDNSEIVQVTTGLGVKEWIFYACDKALFMRRLNALLKGQPAYPIAIKFYDDPEWKLWKDTLELLRSRAA